jgi:hypothetical protein
MREIVNAILYQTLMKLFENGRFLLANWPDLLGGSRPQTEEQELGNAVPERRQVCRARVSGVGAVRRGAALKAS